MARPVVVLTKVPEPGRVKTRLVPRLGAERAASLARAMAEDVLETVARSGLPWRVALDGPLDHPWARGLGVVEPQAAGDLGVRLAHALRDGGVAIGTDAPTLPAALLRRAAASTADLALAPAEDGGYVLVAVTAAAVRAGVFTGVPWSTDRTFAAQVDRARALGLTVERLDAGFDVDLPDDLPRLHAALLALPPSVAPRTRAWLRSSEAPPDAAPHR